MRERDQKYLANTFEHLNDRVIAQVRVWDGLSAAVLGAVVAVYVLFVDKPGVYWPAAALAALIQDEKAFIQRNAVVRQNKRRTFYRSLHWLAVACLAATLCKGYNGHGEINATIHQMASRLGTRTGTAGPLGPELHLRAR